MWPRLCDKIAERVNELREEILRIGGLVDAIARRKPVFRHIERAEQHIPYGKQRTEIGIPALFRQRVMPAVEYWRRHHVSQKSKRPVEIAGPERLRVRIEPNQKQQHGRRNADK